MTGATATIAAIRNYCQYQPAPRRDKSDPWKGGCAVATESYDIRDKVMKLFGAVLRLALAIMQTPAVNASAETRHQMRVTIDTVGLARGFFGLINVFSRCIWDLIDSAIKAGCLLFGVVQDELLLTPGEAHAIKKAAKAGTTQFHATDKYPDLVARLLGFWSEIGKVAEKVAFIMCFAICNPLRMFDTYFPKNLSEANVRLGNLFPIFWWIYHLGSFVSSFTEVVREHYMNDTGRLQGSLEDFYHRTSRHFVKMFENIFEIGIDIIHIFKFAVPMGVTAVMSCISSTVGLVRTWNEL